MYLIFDTETTGLPKRWDAPITDSNNWPRAVQIAWQLHDEQGTLISHEDYLISPRGFTIPFDAEKIHGISTELAEKKGNPLKKVISNFIKALNQVKFIVGQNIAFDINIISAEMYRLGVENPLENISILDTCTEKTAQICQISGGRGGKYKLPTLTELHKFLFNTPFSEAHNATADVEATARCFFELIRTKQGFDEAIFDIPDYFQVFQEKNPKTIEPIGLEHENLKESSKKLLSKKNKPKKEISEELSTLLEKAPFAHLHNYTQFSILQSTIKIDDLITATSTMKMPAVAITDMGNLMGVFQFVSAVNKYNKATKENGNKPIKPVVGCQINICEDHLDKTTKDNGYQVVFLAKNKNGYKNLSKMSSIGYTDGFYYVPRVSKEVVIQYKQDLIALTGHTKGEVPSKILNVGDNQAEEALIWWKSQFGDNLYIELMNHGEESEQRLNSKLIEFSEKHNVKTVATNCTYYIDKENADAHDILLCVKNGEKKETPIGLGRGFRDGLNNQEYYFKSSDEMKTLFKNIPEAIININEIINKIEPFDLNRDVLLPKFDIPKRFEVNDNSSEKEGENTYLSHITYQGAKERYKPLTDDIRKRINFELDIIKKTGYPGYFLIVEDFIREARKMGVSVGPGRGSAAGSVVAYCLKITNINPIKYGLLFERFLNPDRISMPDIDIDFDDEGRGKVIDYVINKYGSNQVAQIITYGTMAAKSAIRDTARVLNLPLNEADAIAKLIPQMSLNKIFNTDDATLKKKLRDDDIQKVNLLKNISKENSLKAQIINQAKILEGSLRSTGKHACGVIITPDDITNFVPITTAKDTNLCVTQFDNAVVENAGLLKMDFLGLSTLTIIKEAVSIIKSRHNIDIDSEAIPLDDEKTYELFQRGETNGIFQYESPGMQKHMIALQPSTFEDLIAMNALYRPGPMEYIPSFIKRKKGEEPITYDLDGMEEYLKETYGITVYQEQVMLLSQKLANFTKGEADLLRKAMGKKIIALLNELKPKFIEGGISNKHPEDTLEKIWKDWEAFASYAFNKSHATCYAWIAYQTAYLKANYPAEFMAAILSNSLNNITSISFFLQECKRMKISVLGPDINESEHRFSVNKKGEIRIGMGAIKGVGFSTVETIVENRKESAYTSIFDLTKRINLRSANKKALEQLALSGAFDSFKNTHRAQYFNTESNSNETYLEKATNFGAKYQESKNSAQLSLFGEDSGIQIAEPKIPPCEEWNSIEKLNREKDVIGMFISGHPLDNHTAVIKNFCHPENIGAVSKEKLNQVINTELCIAGIIQSVQHLTSKNGKGWGRFNLIDQNQSVELRMFGKDYLDCKKYLNNNEFVYIKIKVNEGWKNKETGAIGEPRISFIRFEQLQDVLNKYSKNLGVHFHISELSDTLISQLKTIIEKYNGDKSINFFIQEPSNKNNIQMKSNHYKINITEALINELKNSGFRYSLNTQ